MVRTQKITKTCTRTGFTMTGTPDQVAEKFYRDKSSKDGFSPWCKDAERAYNAAYREANKAAGVARKADADTKGIATFDATMTNAGVRTPRGSSSRKVATTTRTRKSGSTSRKATGAKSGSTRRARRTRKAA